MKSLSLNESARVEVLATESWNASNIYLQKAQVYSIKLDPEEQDWVKLPPDIRISADGIYNPNAFGVEPEVRIPKEKFFALLGTIDRSIETVFKIGSNHLEYTPVKDGELICFANVSKSFLENYDFKHALVSLKFKITRVR